MESSSSAKATMESNRRATSFDVNPATMPLVKTFSLPVRSGWNPTPSYSRPPIRPWTLTLPPSGRRGDFPAPLGPMTPSISPRATSKPTFRSAQNGSTLLRLPMLATSCLSEEGRAVR